MQLECAGCVWERTADLPPEPLYCAVRPVLGRPRQSPMSPRRRFRGGNGPGSYGGEEQLVSLEARGAPVLFRSHGALSGSRSQHLLLPVLSVASVSS